MAVINFSIFYCNCILDHHLSVGSPVTGVSHQSPEGCRVDEIILLNYELDIHSLTNFDLTF